MVPVIAAERVTKSYGTSRGIEDVTLEIGAGELFGLRVRPPSRSCSQCGCAAGPGTGSAVSTLQ